MADYNLVVIVGRLTRDPELRYTADGGTPYARLSMAVNRQITTPDGGPWGKEKLRVPFLFATNGRAYLQQIAEKSGIWFRDARRDQNHGRALEGWYSPEGLVALLKQDIPAANERLTREPTDYLGLRDYQSSAVEKLAKVTRVKGTERDALFVEVRSSAWLSELSMLKEEVLERVNARVADAPLARVVFVLAETA